MSLSLEQEVWDLNPAPVRWNTVLPTTPHHCNISSKGNVLPGHNDAEMGPANSLQASAEYIEYNERFDLFSVFLCNWIIVKKVVTAFVVLGLCEKIQQGFGQTRRKKRKKEKWLRRIGKPALDFKRVVKIIIRLEIHFCSYITASQLISCHIWCSKQKLGKFKIMMFFF